MNQWYPPSGSQRPGPGWEWETAAQPVAGADDDGYLDDGWNPGQEPAIWATSAAGADDDRYVRPGSRPGRAPRAAADTAAATAEGYRRLRTRTTSAMWFCGLLACGDLVLLVAARGHESASSAGLAVSAALVCVGRFFQLRARRQRIDGMTASSPTAGDGAQTGYGAQTRQRGPAAPAFCQEFCEVGRVTAGGNLQPGLPGASFIVQIAGGWLTVTEAPVIPVFSVPADEVQITTPRWQRKIGTGSILRVAGQLWSVQFSRVHQAEAAHAGRGGAVRMMLTAGAPRKSISRAREINARFTAALLAAGAADTPAEQVSGRAGRR